MLAAVGVLVLKGVIFLLFSLVREDETVSSHARGEGKLADLYRCEVASDCGLRLGKSDFELPDQSNLPFY